LPTGDPSGLLEPRCQPSVKSSASASGTLPGAPEGPRGAAAEGIAAWKRPDKGAERRRTGQGRDSRGQGGSLPIRGAKRLSAGRYGGFQFRRVSRGRRQKRCGRSIKPPPRFLREIAGKESKPIQRNGQLGIGFARRTSVVRPLEGTVAFMDRDRGAVNRENEKGGSATNPILPPRPWYGASAMALGAEPYRHPWLALVRPEGFLGAEVSLLPIGSPRSTTVLTRRS